MNYGIPLLKSALDALPDKAPLKAVELIKSHKRIFLYGAGRSGLMLKALAMRLSQMGRTVYVVGETVTPAIGKKDLLILASASGKTSSTVGYADIAERVGATVFVITATPDSPLTDIASEITLIPTSTKDTQGATSIMGTVFEQALLLYCDEISSLLCTDVSEMRARHANLE